MIDIQYNEVGSKKAVEKLGREIAHSIENSDNKVTQKRYEKYSESYIKETASMGNQTNLYTDMVATFIEEAFEPVLIANGVIKEVTLTVNGTGSIKIPTDSLLTAQDVDEHGDFSEDQTGYSSVTIELKWIAGRTGLPIQLLQLAAVDLIVYRLGQIGKALSRRVDKDIIDELVKAGTKDDSVYGDNDNYKYLTDSDYITFDDLIESIGEHMTLDAKPDVVLMNPTNWATFMKDTDVKGAIRYSISPDGKVAYVNNLGGIRIVITTQVPADTIILVDSTKCGYFLRGSGIETWDGREDNTLRIEVVGAMSYGVGIVRPEAVFVIHEDEDEPGD